MHFCATCVTTSCSICDYSFISSLLANCVCRHRLYCISTVQLVSRCTNRSSEATMDFYYSASNARRASYPNMLITSKPVDANHAATCRSIQWQQRSIKAYMFLSSCMTTSGFTYRWKGMESAVLRTHRICCGGTAASMGILSGNDKPVYA